MGATAITHPTDEILQCYGLGKLDDTSSASVSQHLDGCDSCRQRVAELSSDDFLGRLQHARPTPDKQSAPEWSPSASSSAEGTSGRAVQRPQANTLPPELADHPDWEIIRELGRGGMGVVYLAKNKLMGRLEVLKVVGRHLVERPGVADRFLREIQSAARLQHVNIVAAYSAMRLGPSLVLVMEYVEGSDLAARVKSQGPLPVTHACYFIHQAALGLQHAHERGMVHRDIKPANMILAREGRKAIVKVLDFGLAKVTSEGQTDSNLTREGQMLGTPDFIAPEQIRNAQAADIRADIYSLGCTFYYLLTGGPPFRGDHLWDVYQAHFSMDAGPLNMVRPEVPVELAAVVAKMMAKDPGRRFQTPADVARALTPFFKPAATPPADPSPTVPRTEPHIAPPHPLSAAPAPTQPATLGAIPSPGRQRSPNIGPDGVARGSLIEIEEVEPVTESTKPGVADPKSVWPIRRPQWRSLAIMAAASVIGLIVLGIIVTIRPKSVVPKIEAPEDGSIHAKADAIAVDIHPSKASATASRDRPVATSSAPVGRASSITNAPDVAKDKPNAEPLGPTVGAEGNPRPEAGLLAGQKLPADDGVAATDDSGKTEVHGLSTRPNDPAGPPAKATGPRPAEGKKHVSGRRVSPRPRPRANQRRPIVGRWRHAANAPNANQGGIIILAPDGSIHGARGARSGAWSLSGSTLFLRWPNKRAPGGAWVDRVELSRDLERYDGFNQRGTAVHGLRVEE